MVVVDFWATWCAPCLAFSEVFAKVAQQEPGICFVKMNIGEASSEVMETLGILSVPHLMILKKGVVIYSESGTVPLTVLQDLVSQAKALELN
jgi:thioredoxin 1